MAVVLEAVEGEASDAEANAERREWVPPREVVRCRE